MSGETVSPPDVPTPAHLAGSVPRGMLALLRRRGWLLGAALTALVALTCVLLGDWQFDRRAQAQERVDQLDAVWDSEPAPLAQAWPVATRWPRDREWTPVTVTGRYDVAGQTLVRNRPLGGRSGWQVLVPLVPQDQGAGSTGEALLVNRGWLPAGATGAEPDQVPPPPEGEVTVVARLRPPEPAATRPAPPGQVQRIDPGVIEVGLGYPVRDGYGVLAQETPAAATAPRALPRPQVDTGPHLSYALQWYVFAMLAVAGYIVMLRREAIGWAGGQARATPVGRSLRPGGVGAHGSGRRSARERDEDAEDAEVEAQLATRIHARPPDSAPDGAG